MVELLIVTLRIVSPLTLLNLFSACYSLYACCFSSGLIFCPPIELVLCWCVAVRTCGCSWPSRVSNKSLPCDILVLQPSTCPITRLNLSSLSNGIRSSDHKRINHCRRRCSIVRGWWGHAIQLVFVGETHQISQCNQWRTQAYHPLPSAVQRSERLRQDERG